MSMEDPASTVEEETAAAVVTHLVSSTPVETHVFASLLHRKPIYVATGDETLWAVEGDRIRIVNKQLILNGQPVDEPYAIHKTASIDSYRDNFPSTPNTNVYEQAQQMLTNHVGEGAVELQTTKPYEFGDSVANMDVTGSFVNALIRKGPGTPVRLDQEDIQIHRTRNTPKCATWAPGS